MDCTGSYFYLDGVILPTGEGDEPPSGEVSFYEVIRTRNGIPLFFWDHMNRMKEGISTRYDLTSDIAGDVRAGLDALTKSELHGEINVRVTVSFTGHEHSVHICYIPSFYPSEEMANSGVSLILFHAERLDPGVKMLNNRLRLSVNSELSRRDAYEALLVNREGFITEGSRSNVFFITADGVIHTAPDSMVLSGITRKYVLEIISKEGIPLVYEAVRETGTDSFRSAFITGTSPMVLAVNRIESANYDAADPVIKRIREKYAIVAERSISDFKLENEAY
ncbi:MAG: aminotransferase class IV [Bacteroidota bacterium]|nr:aminotransferase class IV [Bacteroidota bacterium]